jgi:hydroxyacylglutathione hydrolase
MFFRQLIDDDLGCASYVVADGGAAVVVDPAWRIEPYLGLAERHGFRITHVLDTHVHADHLSGRERLAVAADAASFVPVPGRPASTASLFRGGPLRLGDLRVEWIDTGGHRPDHVSYLVTDLSLSEEPCLLLCGDSLLVGDVARPDLAAADREEVLGAARRLFGSLRELAVLPDHVEVWPGHVAGSLCGAAAVVDRISSTLGFERITNAAFSTADEAEFALRLVERLPERPPTAELLVRRNRRRDDRAGGPPARLLPPAEVARLAAAGAVILDARPAHEFDGGAIPKAVSIQVAMPGAGTRAAWAADASAPVVAVGDSEADAFELVSRVEAVGFTHVRGVLAGGMDAWHSERRGVFETPRVSVESAAALFVDEAITLVDVRDEDEHANARVDGALRLPWRSLRARVTEAFAPGKPVVVACATGRRTSLAASLLARESGTIIGRIADGGIPDLASLLAPAEAQLGIA